MKISKVIKLPAQQRLLYWIKERESIRQARKKKLPRPWTDDEILNEFRFCNVRRMDDKVSKWILKHWYKPNYNHKNALIACIIARHFNKPSTLEALGFPTTWQPRKYKRVLASIAASDVPIFNGAYIITGKNSNSPNKYSTVIDETTQQFIDDPPELNTDSMEDCVNALLPYTHIGTFMAGQIISDLRWAMKGKWKDAKTWAPIGPGSRRGMNRLLGRKVDAGLNQEQFITELETMMGDCSILLDSKISKRLEAIDYQNCLCEFDKYTRVLLGEGRAKQKYKEAV